MTRWMVGMVLTAGLVFVPISGMAQMKGMCGMGSSDADGGMGMGMGGMMGMGMGMGMGGMMGMGGDMMGVQRMMYAFSMLDLTSEQTATLKKLRIQHQKEMIPLRAKVEQVNAELDELELADKPDLKKVEAKLNEKHDALAKLEVSHLDLRQKMKAVLTPEQREDLELMMERGPMMGGMGMGSTDGMKGKKQKGKRQMDMNE